MRVYLGDDGEVDVEVQVESLDGDVGAQGAVLPLVTEGVRFEGAVAVLHHQDDGVEDTGHGGGGEHGRPDDAVGRGEVVAEDGGGVRVRRNARDVEDAAGALVGFAEGQAAVAPPGALPGPVDRVEARARLVPAPEPDGEGLAAGGDLAGEGRVQELLKLVVGTGRYEGGYEGTATGSGDDVREIVHFEQGLDDTEVVVGKCCAA